MEMDGQTETQIRKFVDERTEPDMTLSTIPTEVLIKGFNFAISPVHVPVESVIPGIEATIQDLNKYTTKEIRRNSYTY